MEAFSWIKKEMSFARHFCGVTREHKSQCDEIYDIFGYEGFIKLSFNKALTGFTAPKILWLRENEPQNYIRIYKILLPKDYIRFMLSGTYATEVSDGFRDNTDGHRKKELVK